MKVWLPVIRGSSGADIFTRRLAEALLRNGVAAEVTWFPPHFQFVPFLLQRVSPPGGTDIIHANSWNGFAFKREGIPLVVTEHLNVFDPAYYPYKSLAQRIYHQSLIRKFVIASFRLAAAITAVSNHTASSLLHNLKVNSVQVIYNWIDTMRFFPARNSERQKKRPFRVLYIGNLSKRKGADLLAPIMTSLGQGFELHFTSGLRGLQNIPVADNMVPLGRLTEDKQLIQAYNDCDVLLFPSRYEGFGLPVVEAMACGVPVIAAKTSSLPELIEDGVTGILCPRDNINAFVTACRKLKQDPEILFQFAKAARWHVEKLFADELIIPQYIALYNKLTKRSTT